MSLLIRLGIQQDVTRGRYASNSVDGGLLQLGDALLVSQLVDPFQIIFGQVVGDGARDNRAIRQPNVKDSGFPSYSPKHPWNLDRFLGEQLKQLVDRLGTDAQDLREEYFRG